MDTDSFVLSMKTENVIKDLKNLEDMFDFSNLGESHEPSSNENEKVFGKFKIETPKNIWIDKFDSLTSKAYSFKSGDDISNVSKGVSKSQSILNLKNIKIFEKERIIKKNVIIFYYVQLIMKCIKKYKKSTLSTFDDKRNYLSIIESKPWE